MNVLEKVIYSTEVTAFGGRDGEVKSADGRLNFSLSSPLEMGGKNNKGTNPEQLFGAGYAACFLSAMKLIASKEKLNFPENTTVTARVDLGPIQQGFGLAVELKITLPDLNRKSAEKLIEKAHLICPYSNAIRNNVTVNLSAQ